MRFFSLGESTSNTTTNQSTMGHDSPSKVSSSSSAASKARREASSTSIKLPFDFNSIPEKPKLPRSPFNIYFDHRYEEMKKDNKELKKNDAKKLIEEEWDKLEMKEPYEELSAKEHHEYKDKKQVYTEFVTRKITIKEMLVVLDAFSKMQIQKAKEAKASRPKRTVSAYGLFLKDYTDLVKSSGSDPPKMPEIAEKWKNLSAHEKEKYQAKYEKLKEESIEALKQWKLDQGKA